MHSSSAIDVPSTRAGRVRNALLPPEHDLQQVIAYLPKRMKSWTVENRASQWTGIKCDEQGRVIGINWAQGKLPGHISGRLCLDFLPRSVRQLELSMNHQVEEFYSGVFDFTKLPPPLETMDLYYNEFTGEVDLTSLPEGLTYLNLCNNLFGGEVHLDKLPSSLSYLDLGANRLHGSIERKQIPPQLNLLLFETQIRVINS